MSAGDLKIRHRNAMDAVAPHCTEIPAEFVFKGQVTQLLELALSDFMKHASSFFSQFSLQGSHSHSRSHSQLVSSSDFWLRFSLNRVCKFAWCIRVSLVVQNLEHPASSESSLDCVAMSSGKQVTVMTSNANFVMWILFVVGLAVTELAAAARELSGSPMASLDATTVTSQDMMLEWLKITAVPLGVFLMGACTWGCIKNSTVWRSLTSERRGVSIAPEVDGMRPAEGPNNSSRDGSDLEEGIALSQSRMDDGPAMSAQTLLTMQQPALQSPNEGGSRADTDVAPQL